MRRLLAVLLAPLFAAVVLAPSLTLLDFTLRRASIARELCVQRDLAEDMRTCHGDCQLSKRLKALEQEASEGFPAGRLQFREDPMVALSAPPRARLPFVPIHLAAERAPRLPDGHQRSLEHVPWA